MNDDNYSLEINSSLFEDDLDNIGFKPIEADDSDEESKEVYGY